MKYRRLGRSELKLGTIGIGTWCFGGGDYWGRQDQADVDLVVHGALDQGINYFDTAEVYNDGASEISLGIALKGRRDQAVIGSKVTPANTAPDRLRLSCEQSLARLGTDHIDIYMLHWPIGPLSIRHFSADEALASLPPSVADAFATLEALQREGKIRAIGLSNHGMTQMAEALGHAGGIVSNELAYNLVSRAIEEEILPDCITRGLGVMAYMPLQQGLLTGRYDRVEELAPMQARSRHFHHRHGHGSRHAEDGAEPEVFEAVAAIRAIAAGEGVPMATLCLAWVVANSAVTTTIVGCRNASQLALNIGAAEYSITPAVMDRLDAVTRPALDKLGGNPDYYENRHASRIV